MQAEGGRPLSDTCKFSSIRFNVIFWLSAAFTVALDLISKRYIHSIINFWGDSKIAIPNFLSFTKHLNPGAVFGLGSDYPFFLIAITLILVPFIVFIAYSSAKKNAPAYAFGLLLGGAVGNMYDRLIFRGVRDFIDIRNPFTGNNIWPIFNLADAAIVLGAVAYFTWFIFSPSEKDAESDNGEGDCSEEKIVDSDKME